MVAGKSGKTNKTNAIRLLDSAGISYQLREYEAPAGFLDGVSVALATGMPVERVFKTLVTQGSGKAYHVCVIPVAEELDLKKAAKHFGEKKLEMIPARDITAVTGYIKGGCSPLGMKKLFVTAIDIAAMEQPTIIVSGGRVGLQMELSPTDLAGLAKAEFAELTATAYCNRVE